VRELRIWLTNAGFTPLHAQYWNGLLFPLMVLQRKVLATSGIPSFRVWDRQASVHGHLVGAGLVMR
jgi:hypothetical protein